MQTPTVAASVPIMAAALAAYHDRLQTSHDFAVYVDILDLSERVVGAATVLDGQITLNEGDGVRRQADLTLSDPAGALDFSEASTWSGTSLWLDRMVRIRHVLDVPGVGEVTAVPFVGVPRQLSRSGAEVKATLDDKWAFAVRGSRALNIPKGTNAVEAIRTVMATCTGETKFNLPADSRRCNNAYAVGLDDAASPKAVASAIASAELGMDLLYSADVLTLRPRPSAPVFAFKHALDVANTQADFSTVANYAQVTGNKNKRATATAGTATRVAPAQLIRNGVQLLLPVVVEDSALTTDAQVQARAASEVAAAARVAQESDAAVVPVFHLDDDDLVTVPSEEGTVTLRFSSGSIPLGVGGDMTIGTTRWVSAPVVHRREAAA